MDANDGSDGETTPSRLDHHGAAENQLRRAVSHDHNLQNYYNKRTSVPTEIIRASAVPESSNRGARASVSSLTPGGVHEPLRSFATGNAYNYGGSAIYASAIASLQDNSTSVIRPSNKITKSAHLSNAPEAPRETGSGNRTVSSILSPLSLRLANIGFPKFKECISFIQQHDPSELNGYNDFLREAVLAYRSGDFEYTRSCVQASLLLRERLSSSPEQASELFESLINQQKSAVSDVLSNCERVIEFLKVKASVEDPSSADILDDPESSSRSQDSVHELEKKQALGIDRRQTYYPPSQHQVSRTERFQSTVPQSVHTQLKMRESASSIQPEDVGIISTSPELETLDPRYQVPKTPAEFFVVGRVFALLWHENLGINNAIGKQRLENAYISSVGFGEKVFSRISRMVVVRRRYGYSWCIGINTYGGRGLAKTGLSAQVIRAHAIVYDAAGIPYQDPGEPDSPIHPIPVLLSPDQQLDKMARLDFNKVYTVEWDVKVMNIGKVKNDALQYLESQWAKETMGNMNEKSDEKPRRDSLTSADSSRTTAPSLAGSFGRDYATLGDDSFHSDRVRKTGYRSREVMVGRVQSQAVLEQVSGLGRTPVDLSLSADSRPEPCHLRPLGQRFAKIKVGQIKECVNFVVSEQAVLKEDPQDYLREAVVLYRNSKIQDARACIQQALVIDHCSGLDKEDIQDYLSDLIALRKSTVNKLLSNVDKTFDAVKTKSDASTPIDETGPRHAATADRTRHIPAERKYSLEANQTRRPPFPTTSDLVNQFSSVNFNAGRSPSIPQSMTHEAAHDSRHRPATGSRDSWYSAGNHSQDSLHIGDVDVRGTEGEFEPLDPRYRQRRDKGEYFIVGRVFAILWHENMGITNERPGPDVQFTRDNRFGEKIFSHIRRMVVIRQRYGYCWCIAINTYGGRGLGGKRRSDGQVQSHTIVYESTSRPTMFKEEQFRMNKEPIAVDMVPGHTLDKASRLNYAKVCTVEHNVKVMDIGFVSERSMPYLCAHWRDEMAAI